MPRQTDIGGFGPGGRIDDRERALAVTYEHPVARRVHAHTLSAGRPLRRTAIAENALSRASRRLNSCRSNVVITLATRFNPMWMLLSGGVLGGAGLL
jgi:hypothetical protein